MSDSPDIARTESKGGAIIKGGAEPTFPVIGIGASAGGLEALNAFFEAATTDSGFAYVVVQHLDPTHESFMVDLLRKRTRIRVNLITDGMTIEPNQIYLIPPGFYLTINECRFCLIEPGDGSRIILPFDTFLRSLAARWSDCCGCVVLSGSGSDGTLGARAVKQQGGLVVAQTPEEATFDNMPRSVIATGMVDAVMPTKLIPALIATYFRQKTTWTRRPSEIMDPALTATLGDIITILRDKTGHDFRLYKTATLLRRLDRRMALNNIDGPAAYLTLLQTKEEEPLALVADLLINVTSFFRDTPSFDWLGERVISNMIENAAENETIRLWIAGCSSGEEVYSLAILFHEQMAKRGKMVPLQVFATDIDPEALATARLGWYPKTIQTDVSQERLLRFFHKKDDGYAIIPSIRQMVTFAVHNLLLDPPYSRLHLIVCRNLLIYIKPEVQDRVFALFQFALADHGILFLGASESLGAAADQFETLSAPHRIFRLFDRKPTTVFSLPAVNRVVTDTIAGRTARRLLPAKPVGIEELAHRAIFKKYAPAAIVVNKRREAVFFDGPIDRYLKLAEGDPSFNVPTMARDNLGHVIRSAIQQVERESRGVSLSGTLLGPNDAQSTVTIECLPLLDQAEDLLLITFTDTSTPARPNTALLEADELTAIQHVGRELDSVRKELDITLAERDNDREVISTLQEEYLSMREEFQSTSEELETSKEELQSTNEELTTLNNHLKKALDCQRSIADDLQNVLSASETATIFLDEKLSIKFFTPPVQKVVNIRSTDLGRPFRDLTLNITDSDIIHDAKLVLNTGQSSYREVIAGSGQWYARKAFPYRSDSNNFGGVVLTFADITDIKIAQLASQQASNAKSAFLATMSHELRTPLNAIIGFAEILRDHSSDGSANHEYADYAGHIIQAGKHLLAVINDILNVSKIESGKMRINPQDIDLSDFTMTVTTIIQERAAQKQITLTSQLDPNAISVWADPVALRQIVYNLLANAVEFTPEKGRITFEAVGAEDGGIDISVIDTGIGISARDLKRLTIPFEQVDNSLNRKHRGTGLGLSIVKGLTELHGGRVTINSVLGSGTSVTIHFPPAGAGE